MLHGLPEQKYFFLVLECGILQSHSHVFFSYYLGSFYHCCIFLLDSVIRLARHLIMLYSFHFLLLSVLIQEFLSHFTPTTYSHRMFLLVPWPTFVFICWRLIKIFILSTNLYQILVYPQWWHVFWFPSEPGFLLVSCTLHLTPAPTSLASPLTWPWASLLGKSSLHHLLLDLSLSSLLPSLRPLSQKLCCGRGRGSKVSKSLLREREREGAESTLLLWWDNSIALARMLLPLHFLMMM